MEAGQTVGAGSRRGVFRLAGKVACVGLLLMGLHAVAAGIDIIPYVGSPQIDYHPLDYDKPFWPQLLGLTVPMLLAGALVSALSVAGLRGRFLQSQMRIGLVRSWVCWALVILALRFGWDAYWHWPLGVAEFGWIVRYAGVNAIVSATLLTAAQVFVGRYAVWSGRPRTRWGEALLWFVVSSVLMVGFNAVMTIIGGLSVQRLMTDSWQMAVLLGGLLALTAATMPRGERRLARPAGLEPVI
jgi:hypothetical protein